MAASFRETTDEEFEALPREEVTDDWSAVTAGELEQIAVAHLDPNGFRYYIPALALSVLSNYDNCSMRVIGTISSLCPEQANRGYCENMYSALSETQRRALGIFLEMLPEMIELDKEDAERVERACRSYWSQYSA